MARTRIIPERHYVDFFGEGLTVTVARTASVIRQWISTVRYMNRRYSSHPLVVGVGVQWTPDYYNRDPPPEVLQLCVDNRCLIIQLYHCNHIPNVLRSFFADENITFVGVWNGQDKRKLETCDHQLEIWRLLDVRQYLDSSLWRCSVEEIVRRCLGLEGVRFDKEISMSDWGVHYLSYDQILYATHNSFVSFKLGVMECLWEV